MVPWDAKSFSLHGMRAQDYNCSWRKKKRPVYLEDSNCGLRKLATACYGNYIEDSLKYLCLCYVLCET